MHGKFLKCLISQREPPTKAPFIPSPLAFDGLRDDIKIFVERQLYQKLFKKLQPQTQHKHTIME